MSNIFKPRKQYKPFEYPDILQFTEAINQSYWVHSEVDFTADVQDFKTKLSTKEQNSIKRALLLIAQIEVDVKKFWGNLYNSFPKPEFNGLGVTFAECEFRHSEAYSRLLTVLGYEEDFNQFLQLPLITDRIELYQKYLNQAEINDRLFYFTLIVENVSLFTQFATILSFARFRGQMKNVANIISWTSVDETTHAKAGIWILNQIKRENPELSMLDNFTQELKQIMQYEDLLVDYIYQDSEFEWFTKQDMKNFMRYRIDDSLKQLGLLPVFNITNEQYQPMRWFDEEVFSTELDDFFAKRPTAYTKHDKSITSNDLF